MFAVYCNFEVGYHVKKVGFLIVSATFLFLGLLVSFNFGSALEGVSTNSPYLITFEYGLISWLCIFIVSAFCNRAMLRDLDNNMSELVLSTPITKRQIVLSRFIGVFTSTALVMVAVALGMMLGFVLSADTAAQALSFNIFHYIWPFLIMVLPTVFFVGSFLFFISTVTRSHVATYIASIVLFGLYMVSSAFIGSPVLAGTGTIIASPEIQYLAALIDPFAISAFLQQTGYWSSQEQNTLLVSLSGSFLANRLLWTGIGTALFLLTLAKFNMQKVRSREKPNDKKDELTRSGSVDFNIIAPVVACRTNGFDSLIALIKIELRLLIKSKAFWIAMVIWVAYAGSEMLTLIAKFPYSNPVYPTTAALIKRFLPDHLPLFGLMMLIFFSGEVFTRERNARISDVIHALPVNSSGFLLAKIIALNALPIMMIILATAFGMVVQLSSGFFDFDLWLYGSLFYFGLVPLIVNGALCCFFQIIGNNRYIGLFLSALFFMVFSPGFASSIGFEHPIFHFGRLPYIPYTKFSGFEVGSEAAGIYQVFWLSCVALLLAAAFKIWARGNRTPYKNIMLLDLRELKRRSLVPALTAVIAVVSGITIIYQTSIVGPYQSSKNIIANQVAYEELFVEFKGKPQPAATALKAELELMPGARSYRLTGQMVLENVSDTEISQILIGGHTSNETILKMEGAELIKESSRHNTFVFELNTPLEPNNNVTLDFEISHQQSELIGSRQVNTITPSHALIFLHQHALPVIGYQTSRTVTTARIRAEQNLSVSGDISKLEEVVSGDDTYREHLDDWIMLDLTILGPDDFVITAPGKLIKTEKTNRGTAHRFATNGPIRNIIPVVAGRYIGTTQIHKGVETTVYTAPDSLRNVDRIHEAAADAIAYFSEIFGPYPHNDLKIVETPAFADITIRGYAAPGMLLFGEQSVFNFDISDIRGDNILIDHVYRIVAREIAHQWWGQSLAPANTEKYEGGRLFSETLARYAELLLVEKHLGRDIMLGWVRVEHDRYLSGRSGLSSPEMPLYRVRDDQDYLADSKGTVAMHALKETLGANVINRALQQVLDAHRYPNIPPVSLDLVAALKKAANVEHHALINDWFKIIRFDEVGIEKAMARDLGNGQFELIAEIDASSFIANENGGLASVPFTRKTKYVVLDAKGEVILDGVHNIVETGFELKLLLDTKPVDIILDPNITLLDRDRENNRATLEIIH